MRIKMVEIRFIFIVIILIKIYKFINLKIKIFIGWRNILFVRIKLKIKIFGKIENERVENMY